ncbi:manganese-dependent inorganic pyrophosphatase [Piscibacillus salipiscarius]|uniref:Probable manganese-dependent inorganic pyrophosphatase n=1 Tax=Piscibacillus salipiscarius TaxID=299480 RepID=A0ABW5QA47_9BACI|nr:manganese-dependent inorganic pyrophosphatase [Piscibacillus salipiscarius]
MSNVLVLGHKNPDTDSICSSIAYATLKDKLGEQAEPVRLGELNEESKYALKYFQTKAPRMISGVSEETERVILVDHNEKQQSAIDIDKVKVIEVIDHHRIANFETSEPIYYRAEPVGCTATIIYKLFLENNVTVEKNVAGLMLSAIISDTLLFKSPTTTNQDIEIGKELAKIAKVELEDYGLSMLEAGTNYSDKSMEELVELDSKDFNLSGKRVKVSQINVVNPAEILRNQEEIKQVLKKNTEKQSLNLSILMITDILNSNSIILAFGEDYKAIEYAFNVTFEQNLVLLEGVVSRKKQMVPQLTKAFEALQ